MTATQGVYTTKPLWKNNQNRNLLAHHSILWLTHVQHNYNFGYKSLSHKKKH